ncbi:MAG: EamA family transporter [Candidatus Lindowbacteria bacterium]|nr:EamA family transporter [Candidatus Lindowbacteria bacterium]
MVAANAVGLAALLSINLNRVRTEFPKVAGKKLVLFAIFCAVNVWTFFAGFKFTSIGNVLIVHYAAPVAVALLSPVFLNEKPSDKTLVALALSVVGLGLVVWNEMGIGTKNDMWGILLAAVSAVAYTGVIIVARDFARAHADAVTLTVAQTSFLLVCALPFFSPSELTAAGFGFAAAAGILHLTFGALCYFSGLREVSAPTAGLLGYSEIFFGMIWGYIFYAETLGTMKIAGAVFIVVAGALVLLPNNKERKTET